MDDELINQLQALLQQYDDRIKALETSVNDVLIGGWKKADAEYKDQEAFGKFNDTYGPELEGLKPYFQKLYGDDFDLPRGLYDELKATEGYGTPDFDEKGLMDGKLAELKDKFAGWDLNKEPESNAEGEAEANAEANAESNAEATPDVVEETVEEKPAVAEGDNTPSVDELTRIYKEYKQ